MRPFVATVNHMTRQATVIHKAKAPPSVCFAIAIWRAALVISMLDPEALSVPLLAIVRNPTVKRIYSTIADASGWRHVPQYTTHRPLFW